MVCQTRDALPAGRDGGAGAGFEGLDLYDGQGRVVGQLNAVIADEYDLQGRRRRDKTGEERSRFYYMATLPSAAHPHRIRRFYRQRWVIENQGFRGLTQE